VTRVEKKDKKLYTRTSKFWNGFFGSFWRDGVFR